MLVQSTIKDLYLLPALPRDKWANGCIKGLKARGGVTVNICWQEGDLHEVGLWSKDQNSLQRLHYRGTTIKASISSGRVYTFNRQLKCVKTYSLWEARGFFFLFLRSNWCHYSIDFIAQEVYRLILLYFFFSLSHSFFWSGSLWVGLVWLIEVRESLLLMITISCGIIQASDYKHYLIIGFLSLSLSLSLWLACLCKTCYFACINLHIRI